MTLHSFLKRIYPDSVGQGILNIATYVFYNLMRFVNFIYDEKTNRICPDQTASYGSD